MTKLTLPRIISFLTRARRAAALSAGNGATGCLQDGVKGLRAHHMTEAVLLFVEDVHEQNVSADLWHRRDCYFELNMAIGRHSGMEEAGRHQSPLARRVELVCSRWRLGALRLDVASQVNAQIRA